MVYHPNTDYGSFSVMEYNVNNMFTTEAVRPYTSSLMLCTYGTVQWQLYMSLRGTHKVHTWNMQGACVGHAGYLHDVHKCHLWVTPHSGVCGTYLQLHNVQMYQPSSHKSFTHTIYCLFYFVWHCMHVQQLLDPWLHSGLCAQHKR